MEQYYKQDAKQLVDHLFDSKIFKDDITRDDMINIEGLIEYLLSSRLDSYIRVNELREKVKHELVESKER